jgi:hypothetical protein
LTIAPWTDAHWLGEAQAWIQGQAARLGLGFLGAIEQIHLQPWATVLRVSTETGDLYFKANAPKLAHEAAVVTLVAARRPDCVPALLAADVERDWMLMADAGTRLREIVQRERDMSCWLEILPLYAGVQLDLVGDADELVALGAPDLRLALLPSRYEQMLDELGELPSEERVRLDEKVPWVREKCAELAAYGIPETIQHDDFHDGQVYVRGGRYLLLDWGDACVSHPFFTLAVTLEGVLSWGLDDVQDSVDVTPFRDAYLEPFTRVAERADVEAACDASMRLGWVCRAVNGRLGGSSVGDTLPRLRMFLDGRA